MLFIIYAFIFLLVRYYGRVQKKEWESEIPADHFTFDHSSKSNQISAYVNIYYQHMKYLEVLSRW